MGKKKPFAGAKGMKGRLLDSLHRHYPDQVPWVEATIASSQPANQLPVVDVISKVSSCACGRQCRGTT